MPIAPVEPCLYTTVGRNVSLAITKANLFDTAKEVEVPLLSTLNRDLKVGLDQHGIVKILPQLGAEKKHTIKKQN